MERTNGENTQISFANTISSDHFCLYHDLGPCHLLFHPSVFSVSELRHSVNTALKQYQNSVEVTVIDRLISAYASIPQHISVALSEVIITSSTWMTRFELERVPRYRLRGIRPASLENRYIKGT